jgi:hypothetical protein
MNSLEVYGGFSKARLAALGFELQVLPDTFTLEAFGLEMVAKSQLADLNLGLWQGPAGACLVGVLDETLHAHERWRWLRRDSGDDWYLLEHHAGTARRVPSLTGELMAHVINQSKLQEIFGWSVHTYWRSNGYRSLVQAELHDVLTTNRIPAIQLHDLTYHYDTWLKTNPAFEGMPRELVYRAHGLQGAREAANELRQTLVSLWPETAFS